LISSLLIAIHLSRCLSLFTGSNTLSNSGPIYQLSTDAIDYALQQIMYTRSDYLMLSKAQRSN